MCCNENDFFEIKNVDSGSAVSIGDGSELLVKGKGKVKAVSIVNGEKLTVYLQDVLFVPNLSCNLISVNKCRQNGMRITFDSDKSGRGICCGELKESREQVLKGIESKESGLFEALIKPEKKLERCHIVTKKSDTELWHTRLGHGSETTMSKTVAIVNGITLKNCELSGMCDVCATCK